MTSWIVNTVGISLGSIKRWISIDEFLGRKRAKETIYTRADYESLKEEHEALHKKIFEEQQKKILLPG